MRASRADDPQADDQPGHGANERRHGHPRPRGPFTTVTLPVPDCNPVAASAEHPADGYAGDMFWIILLAIVVVGFVAWKMRVQILAKVLGQDESRINRQLNRRK